MQRNFTFLAYFFICARCVGQLAESSGQYPFVYYTPKDGLVNSRVRSIKQDSKGFMYFLTYGGLSVYDGTKFKNYSYPEGLANELVNDLIEVAPDSFLIATNTSLLNTLVHGKLGIYKTSDNFYPVINRFFKSNEGNWYVTADEGLFMLDKNRFVHQPLLDNTGNNVGFYLDQIIEWKNFFLINLWNPNRKEKLILYDKLSKKVLDIDTKNIVINCAMDKEKQIWVSSQDNVMLIDTIALLHGKINFHPVPEKYKGLIQKNSSIYFDSHNNLWFYGRSGVVKISPAFQKQIFSDDQGLKTTNLSDMFVDKEGIAWFATDGNGIIKVGNDNMELLNRIENGKRFTALVNQNDTLWLFSNNIIYRIYGEQVRSFALIHEKMINASLYADNQKIYLNDGNKLICIGNKNLPGSYQFPAKIFDHSKQDLDMGCGWIDKYGNIIQYIKKNDSSFLLFVFKKNKLIYQYSMNDMADQLTADTQGRLWFATRGNHLMVFSLHPEHPEQYLQLLHDYKKELPDISPRCISIDTKGNVWLGTRANGVYRIGLDDLKLRSITEFTTQNGLTDNFVYSIDCDNSNTVWIGTQTGLDKIFWKNGRWLIGNVSKSNNFFQSIHKIVNTKNNTIWALTTEGSILKITPSSPSFSATPQFLFTTLQINNQAYHDSSKIFSYQQNNLSFSVAALSFFDEHSTNYSYLLEGSSINKWSKASNTSTFNFINLAPGDYTLKIRADFPEARYPEQTLSYSFTILPPWWQTWWFRSIAGLFIIGLLILIIRFYYQGKMEKQKIVLERKQAIEKERTRIATDMHDDLGAGLSRIKFLSETIGIKKQKEEPVEEDISKIREYSHEMIDKMGEIVWALNEKNDSLSDLMGYTRAYAVEYLSQNDISAVVEMPENIPVNFVSGEFRRNFFLSVKEALHNIVKHSQANHVQIKISVSKNLEIIIHDNGAGFDKNNLRPYSNGLANMEKRMKDLNGKLEIKSNKGTIVTLMAPLPE